MGVAGGILRSQCTTFYSLRGVQWNLYKDGLEIRFPLK